MSAEHLILPGFYGKLPTAGDFVTRRLPFDFVYSWDRWLAQQFAPLIGSQLWPHPAALRFLNGQASFGAAAGIILQSADKVGRQFPLSIVAQLPEVSIGLVRAEEWFASIEEAGACAQLGNMTPDELDATLTMLPMPSADADDEIVDGMVVWTAHSDIFDIDPDAPQATLEQVFARSRETG